MDHLTAAGYVGEALGAFYVGIAVVLLISKHATRTDLSVGCTFLSFGLLLVIGLPFVDDVDPDSPAWGARLSAIPLAGFLASSSSYMTGLLETSQATPARIRPIRTTIRATYLLAGLAGVACALFPAELFNELVFSITEPGFFSSGVTWTAGGLLLVVAAVYVGGWIAIARQRLDLGERARAICAVVISLAITCASLIPLPAALAVLAVGMLIGLYGQFHYLVLQGERSAFLSRFLSPQVDEAVRVDGLAAVMQPVERQLTVVACDLRGFTPYAEAVPSQAVVDLLGEYYDAVGVAVAEVAGTALDYAGDGVLIIIGAPLARDDHAAAGLTLARRLHEVVEPVRDHWGTGPHPLGLGVGVATGRVTVGAVGSSSRMEYTAIGTAVNLAARLCSAASAGETLIDQSTADVVGEAGLHSRGPMPIKGLSTDHAIFALDAATAQEC